MVTKVTKQEIVKQKWKELPILVELPPCITHFGSGKLIPVFPTRDVWSYPDLEHFPFSYCLVYQTIFLC